jgi:hypothetical protein
MKSQGNTNLFVDLAVVSVLLPIGIFAWAINTAAEWAGALHSQKPAVQPRVRWTQQTVTFGPSNHTLAPTA